MQKGESDRLNADRTVQSPGPYDTACFHAQQAAENGRSGIEGEDRRAVEEGVATPTPSDENTEESEDDS
jgi:hypothetical protein